MVGGRRLFVVRRPRKAFTTGDTGVHGGRQNRLV